MRLPYFRQRTGGISSARWAGFTLIEVLIVLAIVTLMMLIIFLSVTKVQRNSRNFDRKHTVNYIASQLEAYRVDHGAYPTTSIQGTAFIHDYLTEVNPRYTVSFRGLSGPHEYVPPYNTVAVEYGHWCNRYGNGEADDDPIAGDDLNIHNYVIWTTLEPALGIYCVDDYVR